MDSDMYCVIMDRIYPHWILYVCILLYGRTMDPDAYCIIMDRI